MAVGLVLALVFVLPASGVVASCTHRDRAVLRLPFLVSLLLQTERLVAEPLLLALELLIEEYFDDFGTHDVR